MSIFSQSKINDCKELKHNGLLSERNANGSPKRYDEIVYMSYYPLFLKLELIDYFFILIQNKIACFMNKNIHQPII